MTDGEYQNLLDQHDHPEHWDFPPGFDYESELSSFRRAAAAIAARVPEPVEVDDDVQDASFHGLLRIGGEAGSLRFSNFGRMAAFASEEGVGAPLWKMVEEVLSARDYVLIPHRLVAGPYTGKNKGVTGIKSWWVRYFDWV